MNKSESSKLKLASNASAEIKTKGTATIVTTINRKRNDVVLNKTLHVPELRTNLLSVSKITNKGYKVVFDDQKAAVTDRKGYTRSGLAICTSSTECHQIVARMPKRKPRRINGRQHLKTSSSLGIGEWIISTFVTSFAR